MILLAALVWAATVQGCASDALPDDDGCVKYKYVDQAYEVGDYATELAAGRIGPPGLPFGPILAYADAVITREAIANSMARLAFQRDSYPDLDDAAAKAAIRKAWERDDDCRVEGVEAALADVKRLPLADTWRALQILMSQNRDYDLVAIASELALRLDPPRFEQLVEALAEGRPANAAMFNHVRWERAFRRSSSDRNEIPAPL